MHVIPHFCASILCPHVCVIPFVSVIPVFVRPLFANRDLVCVSCVSSCPPFREILSPLCCRGVCPFLCFCSCFCIIFGLRWSPVTGFPRTLCALWRSNQEHSSLGLQVHSQSLSGRPNMQAPRSCITCRRPIQVPTGHRLGLTEYYHDVNDFYALLQLQRVVGRSSSG